MTWFLLDLVINTKLSILFSSSLKLYFGNLGKFDDIVAKWTKRTFSAADLWQLKVKSNIFLIKINESAASLLYMYQNTCNSCSDQHLGCYLSTHALKIQYETLDLFVWAWESLASPHSIAARRRVTGFIWLPNIHHIWLKIFQQRMMIASKALSAAATWSPIGNTW